MAVTADNLHRLAKLFMDTGRAVSAGHAHEILSGYRLTIEVGPEVASSRDHQVALLTLINVTRRMFLGGVHVVAPPRAALLSGLVLAGNLEEAVLAAGATVVDRADAVDAPSALIGSVNPRKRPHPAWQLTWSGWRGGVTTQGLRLREDAYGGLSAVMAAAVCSAEAFLYHSAEHPMAGRRSTGLSLWQPGGDWLQEDQSEPAVAYLPSRLWFIGLGNLGQAYLWALGALEYRNPHECEFVLQDIDRIANSNDSTSLLSELSLVGTPKTRAMGEWLERRGFPTRIVERRFGRHSRQAPDEPALALCGLDNALARSYLEGAGFDCIIEAGLGAGPAAFKNFSLHTFPSSLQASRLWADTEIQGAAPTLSQPAYDPEKHPSLDACGLAQLASRTVGVPFVGLMAATLGIAELLRRLHGGVALELISGSSAALSDIETSTCPATPFAYGHTSAASDK